MSSSWLNIYDKEIVQRYLSGESARKIAQSLDSYDSSISYRLMLNGVKKRSISEAQRGKPKTEEHKRRLSITRILGGVARGSKNPNWKGGIQSSWDGLKNSTDYRIWRDAVLKRDNYTCRGCGDRRGQFHLHHILPRRDFPHLMFSILNGITLCRKCHEKTMGKEYRFVALFEKTVNSGKPKEESMVIPSQAPNGEGVETRDGRRKAKDSPTLL